MKKITIKQHANVDTRTMTSLPTEEELLKINKDHISDVSRSIDVVIEHLINRALTHDIDKLYDVEGFLRDMTETWNNKTDFTSLPWYQKHKNEDHHRVDWDENFDKITLEDIIENTIDKAVATASRQGHLTDEDVYKIADTIDSASLKLGLINTLLGIKGRIEITN